VDYCGIKLLAGNGNPSLAAAKERFLSKVINGSSVMSDPPTSRAAESWSASAARNGWVIKSLRAIRRSSVFGGTSWAEPRIFDKLSSASDMARRSNPPSLSRRACAERHSVSVPHQTIISLSAFLKSKSKSEFSSRTSNGTMAELSQNLIDRSAFPARAIWTTGCHPELRWD